MSSVAFGFGFSLLTALIVIAGDVILKHAADTGSPSTARLVAVGVGLYAVSALFWFAAMRHVTLAQAGVAYSMLSLVALALIGAAAFGETIGSRQIAGIGCALAAMVLMVSPA